MIVSYSSFLVLVMILLVFCQSTKVGNGHKSDPKVSKVLSIDDVTHVFICYIPYFMFSCSFTLRGSPHRWIRIYTYNLGMRFPHCYAYVDWTNHFFSKIHSNMKEAESGNSALWTSLNKGLLSLHFQAINGTSTKCIYL